MTAPGHPRLGVDIGGTHVRVLAEHTTGRRGEVVSELAASSYEALLAQISRLAQIVGPPPFSAIGCGLPGATTSELPVYVPALPWLAGRPFAADLEQRLGGAVTLGNDGQFTLLAESLEGAAVGYSSCALIAVGTGIGGALMIDRRIWRGHNGAAGAWGWLPAAASDRSGTPDQSEAKLDATFQDVASGTALGRRATRLDAGWSSHSLVAAARDGVSVALAELADYAGCLGCGLAAIVNLLDIEAVIFAGGLSDAADLLVEPIRAALRAAASPATRDVGFTPAILGPAAGVVGALRASGAAESSWL